MANSNGNGNGIAKIAAPTLPVPPVELNSQSLGYVEELYESFLKGRDTVPPEWATFFDAMQEGNGNGIQATWTPEPPFAPRSIFNPPGEAEATSKSTPGQKRMDVAVHQEKVDTLIRNYRVRGHIAASLDPLGQPRSAPPELDPAFYEFTDEDMDRELSTKTVGGPDVRNLRQLINWLKTTYSRNIGVQFMHIDSLRVREWLQEEMEKTGNRLRLKHEEQVRILKRLADAVAFEEFLAKKFVGKKSFSLEGGETLIPLLDMAIEKAGNEGVREIVIGMAHRGRLNVLVNIMHKSPRMIFREFDDKDPLHFGHGDVKYHLGHSSDYFTSQGKKVHLSLCFNPSHLEYVNTVAQGRIRAKQDRFRDFRREHGCCILIHGDAAFAGEGVVQETLNLAELKGYKIGGTIHIILNNQVGFTTSPDEARSTTYSSDVAKMLQSPIFHVNGEDPEAVAQVVSLALDFRRKFRRDVVIDMYCYRRRGHNEQDEPEYTQPVMYKAIKQRPHMFESYLQHLLGQRGVTREEAEKIGEERRAKLDNELTEARSDKFMRNVDHWGGIWSGFFGGPASQADDPATALPIEKLAKILHAQTVTPDDFTPHPKIQKLLLDSRREMAEGKKPLDWGAAEALAFGSLLMEGRPLRISGQDVRRGTFSHRHAVLYDYNDGHTFKPLKNIEPERGRVEIYNSPLSEAGVLGFEYGYSLDCPEGLVMWEAQFGDFANAGQVIIDQFISSAEDKWDRLSQLVMLLPHGYEGQGPEHSSARLERFLQMAADDNYQICQPSTPAQMFHLLRRQTLRKWKKPLVVMTPKSLFRLPACTSTLEDCATGKFQPIIPDTTVPDPEKVNRILMCSGRVYFDLIKKREAEKRDDVAILRLEELYPLHKTDLHKILSVYPEGTPVVWVQDEPENMGAWWFLRIHLGERLFNHYPFTVVARPASASPATGSHSAHEREQAKLLADAFAG